MSNALFKNDDVILRDDAIGKLKTSDDLSRAAEKLKRGPRLDDVFLLYTDSRKFLEGNTSHPALFSALMFVFGLLGLFAMLGLIGFALQSGVLAADGSIANAAVLSLMAITGGFFGWLATMSLRLFFEDRDFNRNGVLLTGSLTSIGGHWEKASGKTKALRYVVTAAYNVELPNGEIIRGTAKASRPDLEKFDARPKQGTPVAVQYSSKYKKTRLL